MKIWRTVCAVEHVLPTPACTLKVDALQKHVTCDGVWAVRSFKSSAPELGQMNCICILKKETCFITSVFVWKDFSCCCCFTYKSVGLWITVFSLWTVVCHASCTGIIWKTDEELTQIGKKWCFVWWFNSSPFISLWFKNKTFDPFHAWPPIGRKNVNTKKFTSWPLCSATHLEQTEVTNTFPAREVHI